MKCLSASLKGYKTTCKSGWLFSGYSACGMENIILKLEVRRQFAGYQRERRCSEPASANSHVLVERYTGDQILQKIQFFIAVTRNGFLLSSVRYVNLQILVSIWCNNYYLFSSCLWNDLADLEGNEKISYDQDNLVTVVNCSWNYNLWNIY